MVEIPGGCFEGWTLAASETVFTFGVGVLGEGLLGAIGAFAAFVAHVLLVAHHGWEVEWVVSSGDMSCMEICG